jgi:hypothetical protein
MLHLTRHPILTTAAAIFLADVTAGVVMLVRDQRRPRRSHLTTTARG